LLKLKSLILIFFLNQPPRRPSSKRPYFYFYFFRTKAQEESSFELTKPSTGQDYKDYNHEPHKEKENGKDTKALGDCSHSTHPARYQINMKLKLGDARDLLHAHNHGEGICRLRARKKRR
jgi:hypothetical protein